NSPILKIDPLTLNWWSPSDQTLHLIVLWKKSTLPLSIAVTVVDGFAVGFECLEFNQLKLHSRQIDRSPEVMKLDSLINDVIRVLDFEHLVQHDNHLDMLLRCFFYPFMHL